MTESGDSDMRAILKRSKKKDGQPNSRVQMFVYSRAKHMVACLVALDGPLDAVVFTSGIGEHSSEIRALCAKKLKCIAPLKLLDGERNRIDCRESKGVISMEGLWPVCLDIATDEELEIAREYRRLRS